jgi:Tfp pilus assembly PilM family ATPase
LASKARHLGVAFHGNRLLIAEVEYTKPAQVTVLDEGECGVDFIRSGVDPSNGTEVGTLAGELEMLAKRNNVQAQEISFALPSSALFITTIPVDPSLKKDDLTSYLQWELQQYFPDATPKSFVTDSHPLPTSGKDAISTFLVSLRRGVAGFLQRVTAELQLKLRIIDVAHFSVEKTLLANYPEVKKQTVALFGLHQGSLDASLVHKNELVHYRGFRDASLDGGRAIGQYLQDVRQTADGLKPSAVYLYGSAVGGDLVTAARKQSGVQAAALNAFRNLGAAPELDKNLTNEGHRFAAAIGVALRKE